MLVIVVSEIYGLLIYKAEIHEIGIGHQHVCTWVSLDRRIRGTSSTYIVDNE